MKFEPNGTKETHCGAMGIYILNEYRTKNYDDFVHLRGNDKILTKHCFVQFLLTNELKYYMFSPLKYYYVQLLSNQQLF